MRTGKRWSGYADAKYYWHTQRTEDVLNGVTNSAGTVYIAWKRDDKELRRSFRWWLQWLPCWLLWPLHVWIVTR